FQSDGHRLRRHGGGSSSHLHHRCSGHSCRGTHFRLATARRSGDKRIVGDHIPDGPADKQGPHHLLPAAAQEIRRGKHTTRKNAAGTGRRGGHDRSHRRIHFGGCRRLGDGIQDMASGKQDLRAFPVLVNAAGIPAGQTAVGANLLFQPPADGLFHHIQALLHFPDNPLPGLSRGLHFGANHHYRNREAFRLRNFHQLSNGSKSHLPAPFGRDIQANRVAPVIPGWTAISSSTYCSTGWSVSMIIKASDPFSLRETCIYPMLIRYWARTLATAAIAP